MVAWDWNSIMLHLRAINLRASASGFLSRARILNDFA
jgi:hypothetical protein